MRELLTESIEHDPFLQLIESMDNERIRDPRETLNVTPLFACRGAVADLNTRCENRQAKNRKTCCELLAKHAWQTVERSVELQSGIVLAQSGRRATRQACPRKLRQTFRESGLSVTTYAGGFVRLSMPFASFSSDEFDVLDRSLRTVA